MIYLYRQSSLVFAATFKSRENSFNLGEVAIILETAKKNLPLLIDAFYRPKPIWLDMHMEPRIYFNT